MRAAQSVAAAAGLAVDDLGLAEAAVQLGAQRDSFEHGFALDAIVVDRLVPAVAEVVLVDRVTDRERHC